MSAKIRGFENELKTKLQQKCPSNLSEESFLTKCFKFFDVTGRGEINFDQFVKAVHKIGIITEANDLQDIFKHYDKNGN